MCEINLTTVPLHDPISAPVNTTATARHNPAPKGSGTSFIAREILNEVPFDRKRIPRVISVKINGS